MTTLTNGNILIAYSDGGSYSGNFVIYDSAGNSVVSETTFNEGDTGQLSATTLTNGNILIAYSDHSNSYYGNFVIYNSAGNIVAPEIAFNAGAIYNASATTLTNGNILIAYIDASSSSHGNFVIYGSSGASFANNVVIGATNPTLNPLSVFAPSWLGIGVYHKDYFDDYGAGSAWLAHDAEGDGILQLFRPSIDSAPRVWISADPARNSYINAGYLGIGTSSPTRTLHSAGTVRFSAYGAGTLTTDASGNISVSSDERLKDIQGSFDRGLAEILKLDPILYKWNLKSEMETNSVYAGLSAQNVQSAIPEAVGVSSDGYLTLSDRPILAAAINAIKEQNTLILNQKTGMLNLESSIQSQQNFNSLLSAEIKTGKIETKELTIDGVSLDDYIKNVLSEAGLDTVNESTQSSESIPTTDTGILAEIQALYQEFKDMILALGMTSHTDELGNNYLSIDSDVKMAGDLSVLGDTTTSNLTVFGNIQAGTIEIDTAENSINILGVSCFNPETGETNQECTEMTDQTLYLQKTLSGNLDVFNGKLVIEPNGTMKLDGNLEVTGTVKSDTVEADTVIIKETKTPDIELGSKCKPGEMTWDQDYIYICTSKNTWSRSRLELIPGQTQVEDENVSEEGSGDFPILEEGFVTDEPVSESSSSELEIPIISGDTSPSGILNP